jgi:hypothetical protein
MDVMEDHSEHVRLRLDVDEIVPARPLGEEMFLVLATPGMVYGCAAGDTVRVGDDGRFAVVRRGGNVAVHIYAKPPLEHRDIEDLEGRFDPLSGLVEVPAHRRFAVVTVPVSAGFPAIEAAIAGWVSDRTDTAEWFFGNVYDDDGAPLEWWDNSGSSSDV